MSPRAESDAAMTLRYAKGLIGIVADLVDGDALRLCPREQAWIVASQQVAAAFNVAVLRIDKRTAQDPGYIPTNTPPVAAPAATTTPSPVPHEPAETEPSGNPSLALDRYCSQLRQALEKAHGRDYIMEVLAELGLPDNPTDTQLLKLVNELQRRTNLHAAEHPTDI